MPNYFKIGQGNQRLRPASATCDFHISHGTANSRHCTFLVLANQRALLVSRNEEKSLKNNNKTIASAANYVEFLSEFVLFSS